MTDSDLENFDELRKAVKDLRHRLDTVEDKVMMERLEDLAIEDEIDIVKELVGHSDEDIKAKINLLEEVEEKYADNRLDEKLRYLYKRIKQLEEEQENGEVQEVRNDLDDAENRITQLSTQISQLKSKKEGRDLDDVYDKLYLLRDKMKELQGGSGDNDETAVHEDDLDDIYDKLYAVRDKIKEIQEDVDQTVQQHSSLDAEQIKELQKELENRLDTKHDEKLQNKLTETEQHITDMMEHKEAQLEEKIQDQVAGLGDGLRETLEALEYGLEEQEDALTDLRERVPSKDRLDTLEEQVQDNVKAVEYSLEKHDEDIDKLKNALRSAPADIDDETFNALENDISTLEDRVSTLKTEVRGDTLTEDVVAELLQETSEWETMQNSLEELRSRTEGLAEHGDDDLTDTVSGLREQVNALATALRDVTGEVESVSRNVDTITDTVEHVADHLSDAEQRHAAMRNNVRELRQRVNAFDTSEEDVRSEHVLEALEYSSEEIWNRMEEILVRMEHLRENISTQTERIDGLAESQNIFEGEIGRLMENQKNLNSEFEKEDVRIQKRMDLLLEALEEGLEAEDASTPGIGGIQEALEDELQAAEADISELQRNMNHVEMEQKQLRSPEESMKQLTQMVLENQKRMNELTDRLAELTETVHSETSTQPTIIE